MEFKGFLNGLMIVVGGIFVALAVVVAVRRCIPRERLIKAHEVTGNLLSLVGTLYAVLLGLVVVDAMVRFETAINVVQRESNTLADIFMLSGRLPPDRAATMQSACRTYAKQVVEQEWPLMETGRASMAARKTAFTITNGLDGFEPAKESEKAVYPMLLEQIRQLWDCRRERVGTAEYGIPAVEWFVLIVGGVVTVLMTGMFSAESVRLERFLSVLAALLIGLNLYLVSLFGYPFSGELTVSKRPFLVDIAIFEGVYESRPAHSNEIAHP